MPGVSLGKQAVEFVCACGLGFLLGLYYELFRTVRVMSPPSKMTCIFQDVFFCLSSALVTFFAFLGLADGNLYPYLFFGEVIGFWIFRGSLGNVLHKVMARICTIMEGFLKWVGRKIFMPIFGLARAKKKYLETVWTKKHLKSKKTQKKSIFFSKKS